MRNIICTLGLACALSYQVACAEPANSATPESVRATLVAKYPATKFSTVVPSEIPGLFAVAFGKNIIYTDGAARFFLFGRMYDMQERVDMTSSLTDLIPHDNIDVTKLRQADAFVIKQGTGERHLYLFADPMCGYCREMEKELSQLQNVSIHVYLVPILSDESKTLSTSILCATDPGSVWRAWMLDSVRPANKKCGPAKSLLERNMQVLVDLHIEGTPTMITQDGLLISGRKPAALINTLMAP